MSRFFIAVLAVACAFTTFSCSDDDEDKLENKDELIGNWWVVNESGYYTNEDGSINEFNDIYNLYASDMNFTFKEDGTGTYKEEGKTYQIKWSVKGISLKVRFVSVNEGFTSKIIHLSPGRLELYDKGRNEEGPYEITTIMLAPDNLRP